MMRRAFVEEPVEDGVPVVTMGLGWRAVGVAVVED